MILLILSFVAGVLTILAPCTLPILPLIVGSSMSGSKETTNFKKALTISASLGISLIVFTFLLKVSTAFINIPAEVWSYISGTIIILFGLVSLFPKAWEFVLQKFSFFNSVNRSSNKILAEGYKKQSFWGDVIIGASLGPVFSTCSPTYFVILATVLPQSFYLGFIDVLAYAIGLSGMLLLIAILGQKVMGRLGGLSDSNGWFKRGLGALFLIIGVLIFFGIDKVVEAKLLSSGIFDVTKVEQYLLQRNTDDGLKPGDSSADYVNDVDTTNTADNTSTTTVGGVVATSGQVQNTQTTVSAEDRIAAKAKLYPRAPEIVNPSGFVNTNNQPITLSQFKGKKVVLVDFWTYSCINCQRTTPYLNAWYQKYKDQGFEIVSIHTPEFAFEKIKQNVADAAKKEGIEYPIVQDNDYSTWTAFKNSYWPRKYLIDTDGFVVYDNIGEGAYDITEKAIQKALKERNQILGTNISVSGGIVKPGEVVVQTGGSISPETYFGSGRNDYLANGSKGVSGSQTLTANSSTATANPTRLYLNGVWNLQSQYAEAVAASQGSSGPAKIIYNYTAQNVYFVASGGNGGTQSANLKITIDGKPLNANNGKDVAADGSITIKESRMYHLISHGEKQTHTIEIELTSGTLDAFTFTFG